MWASCGFRRVRVPGTGTWPLRGAGVGQARSDGASAVVDLARQCGHGDHVHPEHRTLAGKPLIASHFAVAFATM
jgi:hypothetical protein